MLKMAATKIEIEDGPCCPICLEQFNAPRQLPCAHSFCEKCLQSHITTEAKTHTKLSDIKCPVCRISASPSIKERPTSEWASLFPINTVLQSVVTKKSKVDRICQACNTEGTDSPAEGFCVVCKEAMCGDCLKFHRKQTVSKDHTIINVKELDSNPENVMKLAEGFTCSEHHGEDIKYYCKDHSVACCGTRFFLSHKLCSEVIDLKEKLADLLHEVKPVEMIADMKKIESHLKKFLEINESSVNSLEKQASGLIIEMRNVRKKINDVLDEFEKHMKTEVKRIYKEEVTRKQNENHQCLSQIHAVRNSHCIFEAVDKYGNNLQKFLMVEKMKSQLHFYCNLVGEKYETNETRTLDVEFALPIHSILSLSLSELGKVSTTTSSNTLPLTCFPCPKKEYQVQRLNVIDLQVPNGSGSWYTGVTFLPGDRVMLADFNDNRCILLSSSYQFITSHTLIGMPWDVCALDDQEVAVSLYDQTKIQILSIIDDVIRPVRTITTTFGCTGIAAAEKGEMVVNGNCSVKKSAWSVINTRGDVKCTHLYDCVGSSSSYVALNNKKTRVYVSEYKMDSLICFDMEGRKQFTYSPENLRGPYGVAVDRYDNIFVVSKKFRNIHQLSADGSPTQVIISGVPKDPVAIAIHKSADMFILTDTSDRPKLHIYQMK